MEAHWTVPSSCNPMISGPNRRRTSTNRNGVSNISFFFNDTATTEIYTLSLHDAIPIFAVLGAEALNYGLAYAKFRREASYHARSAKRSEEHTSELQSLTNLVCRLL